MSSITDDANALRRGIRDLVALTTLPTIWAGSPPNVIAESLSDVLLNMLRLDLAYIRLNRVHDSETETPFALARTPAGLCSIEEIERIGRISSPYLARATPHQTYPVAGLINDETLYVSLIPIGMNGIDGYILAGARSAITLSELERLLLSVAANQAVTALQQAYLLRDLREAYQKEQAAHAEAERANQTKLRFLAMISHELRTPLTSIKGFASSLLSEDIQFSPEDQHEYLQIIDEETNKLADLIEQLLDLSRLQAGTMRIKAETLSVKTLMEMIRPRLTMLTPSHMLRIEMPDTPIVIHMDSSRIGQVVSNLVHNATKFAPPHSTIEVGITCNDAFVQFDIQDQGVGIPAEERPLLFEAFRQVERSTHVQKGAGLGLAICKGLVEAHGGSIWIADQAQGTTISFTLPRMTKPSES